MSDYKRRTDKNWKQFDCSEMYKAFAELEDKIENGTLVELPCKVGDTVYTVEYSHYHSVWFIEEHKVLGIVIYKNDIRFVVDGCYCVYIAFLTKAEAEAELEKKRGQEQ